MSKKTNELTKSQESTGAQELTESQLMFNEQLQRAVDAYQTGCFWDDGPWADRWEIQRKFAYYYYSDISQSDGYRANVKSPEIVGRIQGTLQKMNKFNLQFVVRPKNKRAKFSADITQILLNQLFASRQFSYRLRDAYQDAVTNGTAILGVDWVTKKREVEIFKSNPDQMTEEELEKYKKDGIVPTVKVILVEDDGIRLTNHRLENVLFDPSAQSVNTGENRAGYAFVTQILTEKRFKSLYKGKMYKDVDKVKPNRIDMTEEGDTRGRDTFLAEPSDYNGEYIEVVKMYDYDDDKYMIRANGVFIYEGPLPYNDKDIPLATLRAYKAPYQLYGIGLPDLLIPIVTQIELISNAVYDYIMYTTNPMYLVQKQDYGDVTRALETSNGAPGSAIPVSDINRGLAPIKFPTLSVDVFQALGILQKDAVIASQQDPTQLGVIQKNATATANILNKEITEAYVMAMVENFKEDLESVAKMVVSRMHQFMTEKDVNKLINGSSAQEELEETLQNAENYEVPVEDKGVEIDWDEREILVWDEPGEVSFVPIKEDIFKYEDKEGNLIEVSPNDFDIELSVESVQVISRALEKQEAAEELAQLSPFMVDTTDPAKVAQHPMPLVDAVSLMEEVFEKKGWDKKHLIQYNLLEQDSIARAKAQNYEAFKGERPIGHPGESREHINIHVQFNKEMQRRFEVMKEDITFMLAQGLNPPGNYKQEFDLLKESIAIISEHIAEDSIPAYAEPMQSVQKGMAMTQPPQQGMGQSVTQSGIGGNQPRATGIGGNQQGTRQQNPIADAGMQGGPGQLGGPAGM